MKRMIYMRVSEKKGGEGEKCERGREKVKRRIGERNGE